MGFLFLHKVIFVIFLSVGLTLLIYSEAALSLIVLLFFFFLFCVFLKVYHT